MQNQEITEFDGYQVFDSGRQFGEVVNLLNHGKVVKWLQRSIDDGELIVVGVNETSNTLLLCRPSDLEQARLSPQPTTTIKHNQRFEMCILRVNGLTVSTIQNAIVWTDEFGTMVARYGDNLPTFNFVASHFARYSIYEDTLTIHLDIFRDEILPLLCE